MSCIYVYWQGGEVCYRFVKHITQLPYTVPHTECVYMHHLILIMVNSLMETHLLRVINVLSKTRIHTHIFAGVLPIFQITHCIV